MAITNGRILDCISNPKKESCSVASLFICGGYAEMVIKRERAMVATHARGTKDPSASD